MRKGAWTDRVLAVSQKNEKFGSRGAHGTFSFITDSWVFSYLAGSNPISRAASKPLKIHKMYKRAAHHHPHKQYGAAYRPGVPGEISGAQGKNHHGALECCNQHRTLLLEGLGHIRGGWGPLNKAKLTLLSMMYTDTYPASRHLTVHKPTTTPVKDSFLSAG